jgi:catechol 2,3-dioxygenase-like lactoylglutathione lyase family enzyme
VPAPFIVAELDHVVLRCSDQSRMLDFYTRVLGLVEERRLEAIGLIQLRAGASLIDLVPDTDGQPHDRPNVDHFCLTIDASDMQTVLTYLAGEAVETIGEPMVRYGARGYGLSVYCRDPEGNIVELKGSEVVAPPT